MIPYLSIITNPVKRDGVQIAKKLWDKLWGMGVWKEVKEIKAIKNKEYSNEK